MSTPRLCCDRMAREAFDEIGSVVFAGNHTRVFGCCLSCIVLDEIKFCPWCGSDLSKVKADYGLLDEVEV